MRIKNSVIPDPATCIRRSVVRRSVVGSLCLGLICLGIFGLLASHAPVSAQDAPVFLLKIEKIINPVKARVIARAVEKAEEAGAPLLVIEINTPGGLYDSTRDIVGTLLESRVPVAVFVSPRGAHAGSAGTISRRPRTSRPWRPVPTSALQLRFPAAEKNCPKPWPTRSPTTLLP